jgi:hypothetical protein
MEKYNYYLDINFKDRTSEVEALYDSTLEDIKADPEMYAELVNDLLFHWVYGTRETPLMVMVKKQMVGDSKMADGGVMAKGGLTEHGLKIGDEIYDISKNDRNSIYVMNNLLETNKTIYALVDLDNGERIEGIYADGGVMAKGGVPRQRKYDNGGMMAKGGYDDFGYHKVNKEVTLKNGEKIYITKGRYYWSNELGDGRVSGIYYESKDGMISKDSIDKMALGGLFDSPQKRSANRGRSWTLDHKRHNKGESYEIPLNKRKRKY